MRAIKNPTIPLTLKHNTNATTIDSAAQQLNGYLKFVYLTVPVLDSTNTATLNIKDAQGNVLYTKNNIAQNAVTLCTPTADVPVAGPIFEIVTSGNQSADRNFTVQPYVDQLY